MENHGSHIVFYDGECGFCDQAVRALLHLDKDHKFLFAPLNGKTANELLLDLPAELRNSDSLILIEDFRSWNRRIYLGSTAIFRICWLLGGWWYIIGVLFFLPSFLFNWAYRLVARYRHRLFEQKCFVMTPEEKQRFLP